MFRTSVMIAALALLAACGDPLGGMPRISDVDLVENDPAALALPTEAEIAREGFFGTDAATGEGAGVPMPAPVQEPAAKPRPGGFWGLLRRAAPQPAPSSASPVVAGGAAAPPTPQTASDEAPVRSAALDVLPAPDTETVAKPQRRGLFSRLVAPGGGAGAAAESDLPEVAYGTVLPYGEVARSCEAKRKPLGKRVDGSSASGFKIYDTNPGTAGLRTYYITGFADGCPRQLTAAHVLLGAPSMYELLHYGPAGQHLAYGETDRAYEKVKGRVCGARKGKPCGAQMSKLERNTVFINSYPRAKDNTSWSEMLVHDDQVVAVSMKDNG